MCVKVYASLARAQPVTESFAVTLPTIVAFLNRFRLDATLVEFDREPGLSKT